VFPRERLFSELTGGSILARFESESPGASNDQEKASFFAKEVCSPKAQQGFCRGLCRPQGDSYERHFHVLPYKPQYYCLVTRLPVHQGKPMWFAALRMGKNYVSYYLMTVYMNPAMQKRIPPGLKKRMQGKACFNFNEVNRDLFGELAELTRAGFEGYRAMKYV
jgi:hypothetical protein